MDTNNKNEKNGKTGTHIDSVNSSPEDFMPYNEHEFMGTYPNELHPDLIDSNEQEIQYSPKNHEHESIFDKSIWDINNEVTGNFSDDAATNDDKKSQFQFSRTSKPDNF